MLRLDQTAAQLPGKLLLLQLPRPENPCFEPFLKGYARIRPAGDHGRDHPRRSLCPSLKMRTGLHKLLNGLV